MRLSPGTAARRPDLIEASYHQRRETLCLNPAFQNETGRQRETIEDAVARERISLSWHDANGRDRATKN
jgi:hypothetical protein